MKSEATPLLGDIASHSGHDATPNESSTEFPASAVLSLSAAMLVQSYLLVGVFPYSGFLAMHLVPSLTEESAGRYAGLIASSFMAGRTITSFLWGRAADRYGRTFTIKVSLLLSAGFSVAFGLAPTLPLALAARFALGLSNGIVGSIKTIIMEMSHGNKKRETKTMAIVMGMWGYGFLINPAISGYLADPVRQYPTSSLVKALDSYLNLRTDPFLLPNLAGCIFCMLAYLSVNAHVDETLSPGKLEQFTWSNLVPAFCRRAEIVRTVSSWGLFKQCPVADAEVQADKDGGFCSGVEGRNPTKQSDRSAGKEQSDDRNTLPLWVSPSPSTTALTILSPHTSAAMGSETRNTAYGQPATMMESHNKEIEQTTIKGLWSRQSTRKHLIMYWIYSFIVITVDETFPLYCMSKFSGLGVEEKVIGKLLSAAGMGYIMIQYILLTGLVDRYGFYKSMTIGALCSVPIVSLIPMSLLTNRNVAEEGALTWTTVVFVSIIFATARACSSVVFSTLTMTTNRTVPAHQRAAMNGLSMLGGSVGKALGPVFAGMLFSESVERIVPPLGSVVVWAIIASLGLGFFILTLKLPDHDVQNSSANTANIIRT